MSLQWLLGDLWRAGICWARTVISNLSWRHPRLKISEDAVWKRGAAARKVRSCREGVFLSMLNHLKKKKKQMIPRCAFLTFAAACCQEPAASRCRSSSTLSSALGTWTSSSRPRSCPHPSPARRPSWLRSWRRGFSASFGPNSWTCLTRLRETRCRSHGAAEGRNLLPLLLPLLGVQGNKELHGWHLLTDDSCSGRLIFCARLGAQVWRHAPVNTDCLWHSFTNDALFTAP